MAHVGWSGETPDAHTPCHALLPEIGWAHVS
jgi:hypothetical protein